MSGVDRIASERARQVALGWTPHHDSAHNRREMQDAAIHYLDPARPWPWDPEQAPTTTDEVDRLVKAGALIAAEIDRLAGTERADV